VIKVRSKIVGLGKMNRPVGEIFEVEEKIAKYMIKHDQAELIKEEKQQEEKKPTTKKKAKK
jgi:hypothetical protein